MHIPALRTTNCVYKPNIITEYDFLRLITRRLFTIHISFMNQDEIVWMIFILRGGNLVSSKKIKAYIRGQQCFLFLHGCNVNIKYKTNSLLFQLRDRQFLHNWVDNAILSWKALKPKVTYLFHQFAFAHSLSHHLFLNDLGIGRVWICYLFLLNRTKKIWWVFNT